ncbi:Fbox domain containing protein [Acanthamoeba castellanii str. Neff]|uniref:Fbox domain containing protein n=1 Tax=Acanthamoeba castellanii (strain ATCC 30010 / Neff) TaxID=1257118 RepID=L8H275_ACACF|nr:Fbox domain containing protein [Acanthamoeba castellanii str. Neff]ELR19345.1 Fbox domain containing protein [Acanthamoeba castellanii str. Neff]
MDLYTLMEKEDRRHNRGACPVCNVELALADIEGHVNRCLDLALQSDDEQLAKSLARSGYHPLATASSPAAGAGVGPHAGAGRLPPKQGTFSAEDHAYATLLLQEMDADDDDGQSQDFTEVPLSDSAEKRMAVHMTKPGGLALDMAALRRSQNAEQAAKAGAPTAGQPGNPSARAHDKQPKDKGKQRLLVDDDNDDNHDVAVHRGSNGKIDDDGDDSDDSDDTVFKVRLDTMSKGQLKKLCLKQHRKIERMRFLIQTLEKDLKNVRVSNALDDDWQRETRDEWESELAHQKQEAGAREAERRRKAIEDAQEAKAIADALEAVKKQEEADREAAAAAAAQEPEPEPVPLEEPMAGNEEWDPASVEGNGLFDLPREVMLTVFARLAARDLASLSQTCKMLIEPAQDPLLWRLLFVRWIRTANAKRWGHVDEAAILQRFGPPPPPLIDATSESATSESGGATSGERYVKWRYATIAGNGEKWMWDRFQNTLSGFSFCTRTQQKWKFEGSRLRVVTGLFNYPVLEWSGSTLRIQFRPQKAFQCRAGVGIRDSFWNQDLWRFARTGQDQQQEQQEAEAAEPEVENENESYMAMRIAMGGPTSLRAPYKVQGDVPLAIVALVLLQVTGHL